MDRTGQLPPPGPSNREGQLLDSWKEIAAYLRRSERTVRRWEATEGLPVHRHRHRKRGTVRAYKSEIDGWWHERGARLPESVSTKGRLLSPFWALVIAAAMATVALLSWTLRSSEKGTPTSEPPIKSLAILPLRNLSGPGHDYFADGMTEALISELAKLPQLRVIGRTSVMRYKTARQPLPQIAAELGVDAIVTGTTAREGRQVRLTVELLDAATGTRIWANTYQREPASVVALQTAAARGIGAGIRIQAQRLRESLPEHSDGLRPEAYDAYLRGVLFVDRVTRGGLAEGIRYLHRSINADPSYAPAYVALADGYNRSAIRGYLPPSRAYPLAKGALSRAVQLDEESAEAHALLGVVAFRWDWDWSKAERDLKRALELNPGSSRARLGYGTYLVMKGRFTDAVGEGIRALDLDPLSPQRNVDVAAKLELAGQLDAALQRVERTFELAPDFPHAHGRRASIHAAMGKYVEAAADCDRALQLAPAEQWSLGTCGRIYVLAGKRREAVAVLDTLKQLSSAGYADPYWIALGHAALGDHDQALTWLDRAYEERSANLCHLGIDMQAGLLPTHRRSRALLSRLNLAPAD